MLAADINLPRPRRAVDGHGLFENVRVYEWLDMAPVLPDDVEVDELVATSLARMHVHAPPTNRTPDAWYCEGMSRDGWDALVEERAGTWWAPLVAGFIAELAEVPRPEHSPARICHLDVCPENVFLCDSRLVIIDWENAGPAATLQDLGSTLWDFGRGNVDRTRAFVNHYRRHGGPIERLDASVFDTARVVQANLIGFHCRRALDPAGSPERHERAQRALRASLARPLTTQLVGEMVGVRS